MGNVGRVIETLQNEEHGVAAVVYQTEDGYRVEGVDTDEGATFGVWKFRGLRRPPPWPRPASGRA